MPFQRLESDSLPLQTKQIDDIYSRGRHSTNPYFWFEAFNLTLKCEPYTSHQASIFRKLQ
jgi:hypothetical protein